MRENHEGHGDSCSFCATGEILDERSLEEHRKIILAGGLLLALGLYIEFFTEQQLLAQILFLGVVVVSGREIVEKGIRSALRGRLNINFLISIAAAGAFLIGHGEEGAAVVYLFFIAEFLEEYAADRARRSVASLMQLAPETATVKRNGREVTLHVHEVEVGDVVVIRPGDRIPLDGVVIAGSSSVNQAPITGESMPVLKVEGDEVFAGTINEEGYLEIRVTRKSEESTLSKIVKLVEEAQREKSKTEVFIDRFARYYTPAVITLALLVITVPPLAFGLPFEEWFYRGLVLLVISCPCALAISTPVSMVSGITSAARNGVLIKGGSYIEEMRQARVVVFDKTGTLTEGKPEVTDVIPLNRYSEEELLRIAASLEVKSRHPVAEAIVRSAEERGIKLAEVSRFRSIAGRGLRGEIDGRAFFVGSRKFFRETKIEFPEGPLEELENQGKTAVLVGNESHVVGVIALMDRIRDASYSTVQELKRRGIRTVMLTGDNERAARAIAERLAIDEYYAELLPEDKVRAVEELLERYEHVVMVGDGVNDAPALAKAHVGIAMGAIGSDIAIETADIALMHDDISKVIYLIELSKKTMSIVKQNVAASILIKGSFALLTFPGYVTLWLAVAVGDMGLSLAVILNALRIGRER
ncbi:heavy metal translocating P-type ATPase [Candidatus Pyrohabitans sp.]